MKKSNTKDYKSYLSDEDLDKLDLGNSNEDLCRFKEEYRTLRKNFIKIIGKLQGRVELERAKDIVMDHFKCTADGAMKHLSKVASSKNITIEEVAKMIVTSLCKD